MIGSAGKKGAAHSNARRWASAIALAILTTGAVCLVIGYVKFGHMTGAVHLTLVVGVFLVTLGAANLVLVRNVLDAHRVRWMDGVYVVSSCIAAAIAIYANKEREIYVNKFAEEQLKARVAGTPIPVNGPGLASYIDNRVDKFCGPLGTQLEPDFCGWVKGLSGQLRSPAWAADPIGLANKAVSDIQRHFWDGAVTCYPTRDHLTIDMRLSIDMGRLQPPDLPVLRIPVGSEEERWFLCEEGHFAATIRSQLELMVDVQRPRQRSLAESETSGEFRMLLWPAILAFALALRLTKVVADLTKWAPER
jgi:hypothetical protein